MKETIKTKIEKIGFNLFPAFRGSGGRITYISPDYRHVDVKIPLNFRTRNYVGTIFGGSMFSAVDPVYMVMFYKILGKGYRIWVKSSSIIFLKPGKSTLYAKFNLTHEVIDSILSDIEVNAKTERNFKINLADENQIVCAEIEQCIYFAKK